MASLEPTAPAAAPPADRGDEAERVAARVGVALPPACRAGVAQNLALLDEHWANLRGFALPAA